MTDNEHLDIIYVVVDQDRKLKAARICDNYRKAEDAARELKASNGSQRFVISRYARISDVSIM